MGALTVKAVSDSGPLIHLLELRAIESLAFFEKVFIPPEVQTELRDATRFSSRVKLVQLDVVAKDKALFFSRQFDIELGESQALALAKQLKIPTFLTDDLQAREAAKQLSLQPVGTIGIIIASYKKGIISKKKCIETIQSIKSSSSLYVTQELISYAIEKMEKSYSSSESG